MLRKIISVLMLVAALYVIYAGLHQVSFFFDIVTLAPTPPKNTIVLTADDPGPRKVLLAKDEEDFTSTGSMTLTIRTFDRASQTLNVRISYVLPEDLLLKLRGPSNNPVYFPGLDGGIVLKENYANHALILRIQDVYQSVTLPDGVIEIPLSELVAFEKAMFWSTDFSIPVEGNPRHYPDDVYEAKLTVSLDPGLSADGKENFSVELGSYPARIPVDTSVELSSALAPMELVAGTPGEIAYPASPGQWPKLALQVRHDAATVWQARRLVVILFALSAALAVYVLTPFLSTGRRDGDQNDAREHHTPGEDLAALAAAGLAILPLKAIIPGPALGVVTRFDSYFLAIFAFLVALMLFRLSAHFWMFRR